MAFTLGFRDQLSALDHFTRHGASIGVYSLDAYLNMADTFLGSAISPDVHECVRRNGDLVRYNSRTEEFGVLDINKVILTYYIINLDARARVIYPTNLSYFQRQCSR